MRYQTIEIAISPARFMRWHKRLRDGLARRWPHAQVAFRFEEGGEEWPSAVKQLLSLERLLLRRRRPTFTDALNARSISPAAALQADVVIDLVGGVAAPHGARVLRPLYDGHSSDQYAIASLLGGSAPTIALEDAGSGAIVAWGLPSLEAADGLTGGLEAVFSRVIVLIEQALACPPRVVDAPSAPAEKRARNPYSFALRNIAFRCARAIYHLCCHSPHWRVGWRFVDGPDVVDSGALTGPAWRVMQDREMNFAADPFPIHWRGRSGVFYERLDYRTDRGEIYYQEFDAAGPVGEPTPALVEPWHLSYPFLIEHEGELYMAPEASASGGVTLYRCVAFPGKWEPVARMLDGVEAADATIFRHGDRYWITSVVRDGVGGYSDTLALHHAHSLFGPWQAHAQNPVLVDSRYARPAGAVVSRKGVLLRPVQDCSEGYGKRIVIMRIDQLDEENFLQTPVKLVAPGAGWPGARLHTLNRCGRLECIDGAIFTPKNLGLRRIVHERIDARALYHVEAQESPLAPALL
ncbi:hypothetical protein [Methylocystis sp. ATCC 49242]|uniref:glucosamine inositolphosphorylceramide transferase family protein n=1 Tax=Methylocystis sp. ATCC 49242 TaxID=622637 RepID=UPI0001F87E0E|nr:hypothetical protein [Methylocystis sp. ATCC 49242]